MRAKLSGAFSAAVLLLASAPAVLATPAAAEELSVTIPVRQADLDSETALASLYERVELAARRICRTIAFDAYDTGFSAAACRRETVAQAIERANLAPLTAYHLAAAGRDAVPASPVLASR